MNIEILKIPVEYLFFQTFYFEIMVESQKVVRNSTQRFLYTLHSVSPSGNISKNYNTISQPGNSHWYTLQTLFGCRQFYMHPCVCVCVCVCVCFILYSFITCVDSGDHVKYVFKHFLLLVFHLGFTFECIHVCIS